jgi:tetratricopeptide (TPR) repeat protein
MAYSLAKKFNESVDAYKMAVNLRPEDATAHYGLATSYLAAGNREAALKEYEVLKELDGVAAEQLLKNINKPR